MALKYADKVELNRQKEISELRNTIISTLEDSKKLAMECDNLVKLRALKTRCEKVSKPRPTVNSDKSREANLKQYHANKERYGESRREKRQKIRQIAPPGIISV